MGVNNNTMNDAGIRNLSMTHSSHAHSNTWKAYTVEGLVCAISALPPKADIAGRQLDVRFVPKADILRRGKERRYSITSSARAEHLTASRLS
jgi:hypothetical protein